MTVNHSYNIERYEILKKEVERFPSVFIEGAACCGKTTLVRQYLKFLAAVDAENENTTGSGTPSDRQSLQYGWFYRTLTWGVSDFEERLADCLAWVSVESKVSRRILVLNYRINSAEIQAANEPLRSVCDTIRSMPSGNRILIESREKPFPSLLDLIWHSEMGILSQKMLALTEEEVLNLIRARGSRIPVRDMMRLTGGWAGVVQMLITVEKTFYNTPPVIKSDAERNTEKNSVNQAALKARSVNPVNLMKTYEIRYFIQEQILSTLTLEEQVCVDLIRRYGWVTEEMVQFFVPLALNNRIGIDNGVNIEAINNSRMFASSSLLEDMVRKGILFRYEHSDKYHIQEMFLLYEKDRSHKNYGDTNSKYGSLGYSNSGYGSSGYSNSENGNAGYTNPGNGVSDSLSISESMIAFWYEEHGYLQEAADLFSGMSDTEFEAFLIRKYSQVPFLKVNLSGLSEREIVSELSADNVSTDETSGNTGTASELVYLRGIAALRSKNRGVLNECVSELDSREGHAAAEMLINLVFADPRTETADWYKLIARKAQKGMRFHLYYAAKRLDSCLYGVRELSDHFACLRREQSRYERLFETYFGSEERKLYVFARAEYLAEACQADKISDEDWELMAQSAGEEPERYHAIVLRILSLYMDQMKIHSNRQTSEQKSIPYQRQMDPQSPLQMQVQIENKAVMLPFPREILVSLVDLISPDSDCYLMVQLTGAAFAGKLFMPAYEPYEFPENNKFVNCIRWINENDAKIMRLDPEYYHYELFLLAKTYVLLNQYAKAERILKILDPVLNRLTFSRLHAEALFLNARVHKKQGRNGLASREVVESFAVSDPYRYAAFYTQYGDGGRELMADYLDWLKKNSSYRVHKKRYQYGSLLNVPQEEFIEVLIRKTKKQKNTDQPETAGTAYVENTDEKDREHLTMMELIILQDLHEGLSNSEICEKENLKLPTVKTHLYNLYRKLGVKNRGQAVKAAVERNLV